MIITIKGATFTNNIGTLDSWRISTVLGDGAEYKGDSSIKKENGGKFTATVTIKKGYTIGSAGISVTMGGVNQTNCWTTKQETDTITITFTINSVDGNVVIKVPTKNSATGDESGSGSGGTTTNYTFTLTPDPISATVTLSATGYSTVSGTGSKSITVANGTKVNWTVSASGYTTRTGNWTINGGNKTESIALTTSGGGSGTSDITSYVVDGKAITSLTGPSGMSGFFTVVNYPAREGFSYKIPYGRNGYFSNASGTTSTSIFQGGGSASFVTPDAPAGTTMLSVCFKHVDLAPADVIIEEREGSGAVANNPDIGVTTTSYGGEVKPGYMVGSTGGMNTNTATNGIDMIPVKPSTKYQLVAGCRNTAILNSAGEVITTWGGTAMESKNYIFTTTADTAYLRTCYYWNDPNYPRLSAAKFTLTEVTE